MNAYHGEQYVKLLSTVDGLERRLDRSKSNSQSIATTIDEKEFRRRRPLAPTHDDISAVDHARLYLAVFRAFDRVMLSCFGGLVERDYREHVRRFDDAWDATGSSITPSVHMVTTHVVPFVEMHGALGPFGEYTGENMHQVFKQHMDHSFQYATTNPKVYMPLIQRGVSTLNGVNAG